MTKRTSLDEELDVLGAPEGKDEQDVEEEDRIGEERRGESVE